MRYRLTIPGIDDRLLSTMKNKSFKPEVLVDGQWSTNGLRFATAEEAFGSVMLLRMRWWVPTDGRATESEDPVNYRFENNQNVPIEAWHFRKSWYTLKTMKNDFDTALMLIMGWIAFAMLVAAVNLVIVVGKLIFGAWHLVKLW